MCPDAIAMSRKPLALSPTPYPLSSLQRGLCATQVLRKAVGVADEAVDAASPMRRGTWLQALKPRALRPLPSALCPQA
eukprot:9471271-Pyramimonas_sp.AAC.1